MNTILAITGGLLLGALAFGASFFVALPVSPLAVAVVAGLIVGVVSK